MAQNKYEIKVWGEEYKVSLEIGSYAKPKRIALQLWCDDGPFATVSVNLPDQELANEKCFFVDTNNCPWAEDFLEKNGIAKPTGNLGFSGYCVYPEYELLIQEEVI